MTHILHRQIQGTLPTAVGGRGVELFDADGKAYIDASGGAAVSCLGHGHPDVVAAIKAQADTLAFAHTGFFTSEPAEALADRLVADAPEGLDYVYFLSGGSEAVEAAIKMARQYFVEIGEPGRHKIIAREQSYHGNTVGALSAGGNMLRRALYQPILLETHHIPPCYAYRHQNPGESDAAYAQRAADALEAKLLEVGPDTVMAFVAETVVGATSGVVPPVADYFKRIRAICDKIRRVADPGRSDVRHGPHRHPACLRAGRHLARPDDHRQGSGRRLSADRRGAAVGQGLRRVRQRHRLLPARPHLHGPPDGLRRRARGAGGDRA